MNTPTIATLQNGTLRGIHRCVSASMVQTLRMLPMQRHQIATVRGHVSAFDKALDSGDDERIAATLHELLMALDEVAL